MYSSSEESKTKHDNFYRSNEGSNIGLVRDDDTLEICYDLKGITCDSAIRLASGAKGAKVKNILSIILQQSGVLYRDSIRYK